MELLPAGHAGLDCRCHPLGCSVSVRIGGGAVSGTSSARKDLASRACIAGLLGHSGLPDFDSLHPRDVWKYQLFTNELFAYRADCVGDRDLGHELLHVALCRDGQRCSVEVRFRKRFPSLWALRFFLFVYLDTECGDWRRLRRMRRR